MVDECSDQTVDRVARGTLTGPVNTFHTTASFPPTIPSVFDPDSHMDRVDKQIPPHWHLADLAACSMSPSTPFDYNADDKPFDWQRLAIVEIISNFCIKPS